MKQFNFIDGENNITLFTIKKSGIFYDSLLLSNCGDSDNSILLNEFLLNFSYNYEGYRDGRFTFTLFYNCPLTLYSNEHRRKIYFLCNVIETTDGVPTGKSFINFGRKPYELDIYLSSPEFEYNINSFEFFGFKNSEYQSPVPTKSRISYFTISNPDYLSDRGIVFHSENGHISYNSLGNLTNSEINSIFTVTAYNSSSKFNSTVSNSIYIAVTSDNSFSFSYNSIILTYNLPKGEYTNGHSLYKPTFIFSDTMESSNSNVIESYFVNRSIKYSIVGNDLGFTINSRTGIIGETNNSFFYHSYNSFIVECEYIYQSEFHSNSHVIYVKSQHKDNSLMNSIPFSYTSMIIELVYNSNSLTSYPILGTSSNSNEWDKFILEFESSPLSLYGNITLNSGGIIEGHNCPGVIHIDTQSVFTQSFYVIVTDISGYSNSVEITVDVKDRNDYTFEYDLTRYTFIHHSARIINSPTIDKSPFSTHFYFSSYLDADYENSYNYYINGLTLNSRTGQIDFDFYTHSIWENCPIDIYLENASDFHSHLTLEITIQDNSIVFKNDGFIALGLHQSNSIELFQHSDIPFDFYSSIPNLFYKITLDSNSHYIEYDYDLGATYTVNSECDIFFINKTDLSNSIRRKVHIGLLNLESETHSIEYIYDTNCTLQFKFPIHSSNSYDDNSGIIHQLNSMSLVLNSFTNLNSIGLHEFYIQYDPINSKKITIDFIEEQVRLNHFTLAHSIITLQCNSDIANTYSSLEDSFRLISQSIKYRDRDYNCRDFYDFSSIRFKVSSNSIFKLDNNCQYLIFDRHDYTHQSLRPYYSSYVFDIIVFNSSLEYDSHSLQFTLNIIDTRIDTVSIHDVNSDIYRKATSDGYNEILLDIVPDLTNDNYIYPQSTHNNLYIKSKQDIL